MEDDQAARIAALATQVALLHNALRAARKHIPGPGETFGRSGASGDTYAIAERIDAALESTEGECAHLLELARKVAEILRDTATAEWNDGFDESRDLITLLDVIEGKIGRS